MNKEKVENEDGKQRHQRLYQSSDDELQHLTPMVGRRH
jgi:hypothetical protein